MPGRYERDQELGDMVNELTEAFFQRYPRSFDDPWPSVEHKDQVLHETPESLNDSLSKNSPL